MSSLRVYSKNIVSSQYLRTINDTRENMKLKRGKHVKKTFPKYSMFQIYFREILEHRKFAPF